MQLFQDRRFILGGASTDMPYMYGAPDALPPFDRSGTNGFRLISYSTPSLPPRILRGHFHFKNLTTETSYDRSTPRSRAKTTARLTGASNASPSTLLMATSVLSPTFSCRKTYPHPIRPWSTFRTATRNRSTPQNHRSLR